MVFVGCGLRPDLFLGAANFLRDVTVGVDGLDDACGTLLL